MAPQVDLRFGYVHAILDLGHIHTYTLNQTRSSELIWLKAHVDMLLNQISTDSTQLFAYSKTSCELD